MPDYYCTAPGRADTGGSKPQRAGSAWVEQGTERIPCSTPCSAGSLGS